jgi:small conductance mechanosensitive channel
MQVPAASTALPANTLEVTLAVALTLIVAGAVALLAGSMTRRLLRSIEGDRFHVQHLANATVRIVRRVTFGLFTLVLLFPALDFAGLDLKFGFHGEDVADWTTRTGVRVSLLLLMAFATNRFAASVIRRAEGEVMATGDAYGLERRKRAKTLGATFGRFLSALIWSTAVLVILRELDVDITPVLTGAGILGLAVGFGAQTLVKDMIAGIFIIAEDQVRVGDAAIINGVEGAVEEINLRTIVLRNVEGVVYTISNGDIRTMANRSKEFAYYVISLGVDFDDDSDDVAEVAKAAGAEMQQDPAYGPLILAPLEVFGMEDVTATTVTIRFRIKTLPGSQWEVGRELRRRIKRGLKARGIKLPGQKLEVTLRQPDPGV